ncbi:DUF4157 domain-containing protein [Spartinivicinus poritis]|uniref:DUF4157 domain-containing protein n=1 Tax=Spartinivicinus poritis TaxID=2994640 RepID=A0ABT5U385_9GAMM|nr:DUF4157 domain-containing protein [Spartinivicinus sp. A2-2]MDE1460680.1 DUF4157 domain-containing protein [Spartinivicinus sp. A2-2]
MSTYQLNEKNKPAVKQNTTAASSAQRQAVQQHQTKQLFKDNRQITAQLQALQQQMQPVQRQSNHTGLPDKLKSGMENLSGMSLDHVKVHYNSSQPAAVQAHAYAQGANIHLASGQEKHLPHELGHVVQQMQGRVKPTTSVGGVAVNDDASLEHEADVMGAKALQMKVQHKGDLKPGNNWVSEQSTQRKALSNISNSVIQRELLTLGEWDDEPNSVSVDRLVALREGGRKTSPEDLQRLREMASDSEEHIFSLNESHKVSVVEWTNMLGSAAKGRKALRAEIAWKGHMKNRRYQDAMEAISRAYGFNTLNYRIEISTDNDSNASTGWRDGSTGRTTSSSSSNKYLSIKFRTPYLNDQYNLGTEGFIRVLHTFRHEYKHVQQYLSSRRISTAVSEFEAYASEVLDDNEFDLIKLNPDRFKRQAYKALQEYTNMNPDEKTLYRARKNEIVRKLRALG